MLIRRYFLIYVLFMLQFFCTDVHAARPLTVDDVGVLEKGFQLELSSDSDHPDNAGNVLGVVVNLAIAPSFQVGIENGVFHYPPYDPEGHGDTALTAKWNYADAWGMKAIVNLDNGEFKGSYDDPTTMFGDGKLSYTILLLHELGIEPGGMDLNIGYTCFDRHGIPPEHALDTWSVGLSKKLPLGEQVLLVGEVTKLIAANYVNPHANELLFRAGIVYDGLGFPLDCAVYSLPWTTAQYGFTLGVTIPFGD